MRPLSENTIPSTFFDKLRAAAGSVLFLDYDGTLAPFETERSLAYPYPEVLPLLERIVEARRSRVVIVSGRSIADLQPLLHPLSAVEMWGSHGIEHLSADGTYMQCMIPSSAAALLSGAESWLVAAGLASRMEMKPGGIAVHWRGLSESETREIYTRTRHGLRSYVDDPELKLLKFDGGVELRVAHPDKGDAVTSALNGSDPGIPVAYLGDDHTDEAAFLALKSRGLTVLVRPERRTSHAHFWLRPPGEVIHFLQQWCDCVSANTEILASPE